jgi:Rps23 Pro-64 3,4-dihydroxylase Tpa1-like proline 4-hydroxylase
MKSNIHFLSYLAQFFLEREMFQTKVVEKIKTHIWNSVTFFLNRAVYERMWLNTVEPDRPQMAIYRVCIAGWILKATNTHS